MNCMQEDEARKRERRENWRAVYLERGPGGSEGSSVKPSRAIRQGSRFLPYQATKAKKWGKVKALQRLLTRSAEQQSSCCTTSDGKSGVKNAWCGRRNLDHAKSESTSHPRSATKGVSSQTAQTGLPPKKLREDASPLDSLLHRWLKAGFIERKEREDQLCSFC
jgi:hypothetical protein